MCAIHLHVAVGTNDQDACTVQIARKIQQQVERPSVGVVQVFEHQEEWVVCGGTQQKVRRRLQQPPAVLFGISRWRRGDVQSLAQHRNHAGKVGCARSQLSRQRIGVAVLQVGSEHLDERLIGWSERTLLIAMPHQWRSARCLYEAAQLLTQSGLTDAGLTHQHDQRAMTHRCRFEHCL